jgi:hypothetical protein
MAAGEPEDIERRLSRALPPWFGAPGGEPPVLRTVLAMPAAVFSYFHGMIAYARKQTRIATADGGWLDLIAHDFFGARVRRRRGQSDEGLRARIKAELFRPRGTRQALRRMLLDVTGREPRIFEPSRPGDTGGWASNFDRSGYGMGWGVSGGYGSLALPAQVFVDVFRTPDEGIPGVSGWGQPAGGWSTPSALAYVSTAASEGTLTDRDIIDAIEAVRPAGVKIWVRFNIEPGV